MENNRDNENSWVAICIIIALGGVAGMWLTGNAGFDAGREMGIIEGQAEAVSEMGWQVMTCNSVYDKHAKKQVTIGNDCETIYNSYQRLGDKFGYGEQRYTKSQIFWSDRFGD
jgi:hypothetical protein